ncbi:hypothetical protein [Nocardiopsis coralliicola]
MIRSYDRSMRMWDADTCEERGVVGMHRDRVTSVDWTSDARLVVSGSHDATALAGRFSPQVRPLNQRPHPGMPPLT